MTDTRFKSKDSDAQLVDAACDVLLAMQETGADRSQRVFNSMRDIAGHSGLPRADQVCSRLGIPWATLLELPNRSATGRSISLAKPGTYEPDANWVTTDQIAFALRLVAFRMDRVSFSSANYRRERAAIVGKREERLLPTEEQILAKCGSCRAALAIAGLALEDDAEVELERLQDAFGVLDEALEAHGLIPTYNEIIRFARVNGMRLPDVLKPYGGLIELWRGSRIQRGQTTPPYEPRRGDRPDFGRRVINGPTQRVRRGHWTEERAIEAMRRFLKSRTSGEPCTRKAYVDWQRGRRDAPAASLLGSEFGGFARIRRLASLG